MLDRQKLTYRFRRQVRLTIFAHTPEKGRTVNAVVKAANITWDSGEPSNDSYVLEGYLRSRQIKALKALTGLDYGLSVGGLGCPAQTERVAHYAN